MNQNRPSRSETDSGHSDRAARFASVPLLDELQPAQAGLIVVAALIGPLRQLDLLPRDLLVRDFLGDVRDAVAPPPSRGGGANRPPRRMPGVGRLEHHVAC